MTAQVNWARGCRSGVEINLLKMLTFSLRRQNLGTDVAEVRATAGMLEILCAVKLCPILIGHHVAVASKTSAS